VFGLSVPELLLIGIVALLIFGPDKLPEIARQFGKLTGELKRQSDGLRREFYNSVYPPADESSFFKLDRSLALSDTCEAATLQKKVDAHDKSSESNLNLIPPPVTEPLTADPGPTHTVEIKDSLQSDKSPSSL
jgi:sec-independent protein translocase protein TatB